MALVLKDRVKETTTTTGTGSFSLAGAVTGYDSFGQIGTGNTTYYAVYLDGGSEWEVGIGTYTAPSTLSRDTILASSNSGSVVTFSAGQKTIWCDYPAGTSVYASNNGSQTSGQVLKSNGVGTPPTWQTTTNGDVVGPASATDNAIARFDTTTGKLIENSLVIIDDTGSVTGVNALTVESLTVNNNATLGSSNTDTLDVRARISSDLEPNTDAAHDIGTSGRNWRDGFFSRNLQAEGKVVSPHFDALNSAGGQLRNSGGTPQLQWGGGGGNNLSVDVAININPANAQVDLSPTGTGTVRINPATAGTMNNMVIGGTAPLAITGTTITANTQFSGAGTGLTGTATSLSIGGNAATVTNGVYTTGSYANPSWITSLDGSKITGNLDGGSF